MKRQRLKKRPLQVKLLRKSQECGKERKHWQRDVQDKRKQRRFQQVLILAVLVALVLVVLVPAGAGLAAYSAYNNISALAHDGVNHLLKVKSILNVSKIDPTAALNATKL